MSSSSGRTVSVVIPAMKRLTFTSSYSECESSTIWLAFPFTATTVQFKVHLTLTLRTNHSLICALSLRNLVSGYECRRVFPGGVGPGSPSRDAANWLPSRFSLSGETRRRYGWLRMMVFPGARLLRAPIWCPSGGWRHARGREYCRGEPGSALSGEYAPYSAKAEGSSIVDEPGEG